MNRLNAYTRPAPDGRGVIIDIEGMAVDLITAAKAGHMSKEEFLSNIESTWDAVIVELDYSNVTKQ